LDNSLNSQSNTNTDRFLQQLTEENSELISKLWTDIQQKIVTQSQITPPGTPSSALSSGEQRAALNATNAVNRFQTRLQPEESTETLDSSYVVGHVLNSRKQKQLLNKEGAKRTIEVSIPGAEAPESSKCSTVSPVSEINTRRSSGATSNSCSPLNATSGSGRFTPLNPRAKIEKQNEEGWFALSTHVS
ncbi:SPICE1 isoform 7, partial [Pongo abelii]